jgi:hypothetical protein
MSGRCERVIVRSTQHYISRHSRIEGVFRIAGLVDRLFTGLCLMVKNLYGNFGVTG